MRLDKFEKYKLTFGPTPIEALPRLSAHLGGDVELFGVWAHRKPKSGQQKSD